MRSFDIRIIFQASIFLPCRLKYHFFNYQMMLPLTCTGTDFFFSTFVNTIYMYLKQQ